MSVNLAETAGFCMGVKRAMDRVLDIAQGSRQGEIYTYGPLIHNPQTIEMLKKRGVTPIESIDTIPEGKDAVLIIRTHGISPEERKRIKKKNIRIVDATCPKVARVQAIIKKYVNHGYAIVIVGDKGHPEVEGLLGYAAGRGMVVANEVEAESLPLPPSERVVIVAQTTQDADLFVSIAGILLQKFPQAIVMNTICDSTEKRQKDVKALAARMDAMVIVGGANSANTRRLAEMSKQMGKPTFAVETAEELNNIPLNRYKRVGVSAGASTPNWIIDRVVNALTSLQAEQEHRSKALFKFWLFLVRTDIYSALGAGSLYVACAMLQNLGVTVENFLIASLYVFGMHVLNRFTAHRAAMIGSFREETYRRHKRAFILSAITALLCTMVLSLTQGMRPFLLLCFISLLGILYNAPILPSGWRVRSFKELPGSKNISMSLAWAMVTAVLPVVSDGVHGSASLAVAFCFTFVIVFIRSVLSDIVDVQNDRLIGQETIPVVLGQKATLRIITAIWLVLLCILVLAYPLGWSSSVSFALLLCLFYVLLCLKLCDRRAAFSGMVLWGLLETNYLIAGAVAGAWRAYSGYAG